MIISKSITTVTATKIKGRITGCSKLHNDFVHFRYVKDQLDLLMSVSTVSSQNDFYRIGCIPPSKQSDFAHILSG